MRTDAVTKVMKTSRKTKSGTDVPKGHAAGHHQSLGLGNDLIAHNQSINKLFSIVQKYSSFLRKIKYIKVKT